MDKFFQHSIFDMKLEQVLEKELEESKLWLSREHEESTYKRDLNARIELLSWVLKNMKNPEIQMCNILECRMKEITLKINQTHSIIQSDKLHSELRILNWILYQVCNRYMVIIFFIASRTFPTRKNLKVNEIWKNMKHCIVSKIYVWELLVSNKLKELLEYGSFCLVS